MPAPKPSDKSHKKKAAKKAEPPHGLSLLNVANELEFIPHNLAIVLEPGGKYSEPLEPHFPFLIRLFHFQWKQFTSGETWHERLELFMPLDGPARLRMGQQFVDLNPGDLLVVDNLKMHCVLDLPNLNTRVIVISFLPEFVYNLGSSSVDYTFLLPFYSLLDDRPHVLRASKAASTSANEVLAKLLHCYFNCRAQKYYQSGCKAFFLELLYYLANEFRTSEMMKRQLEQQQTRSVRLKPLFDYLREHFTERITLEHAAKIARMPPQQMMKLFKSVAGMTFVTYVTHVRLTHSLRLLKETDQTIAEIAANSGFTDQSYFDRRFKKTFGQSPRQYRDSHFSSHKPAK